MLSVAALLTAAVPAQADPRVGGDIGVAYERDYGGARGVLGEPLTPEIRTPNGRGAYVGFQHGSIYWSPWTGAHAVRGELRNGWGRLGWEGGRLGFPKSSERPTDSRRAVVQDFEGGRMYWTPSTGAHALQGAILERYELRGDPENGRDIIAEQALGFPTSSEIRTPNGKGAYNTFQWGAIYWEPQYGAHPIFGAIRSRWGREGWENGCLGFPITEEYSYEGYSTVQEFQGGWIWFHPSYGTEVDLYPRNDPSYSRYGLYPRC
ncbi:LGFP repeat-containing protein [Kineococcus xinjiangensis]|uniref:LGFP repeat-containing protein n=1 Tax=Kineococcus xinjiangensis TaxID=512762 RepID=A0A2S6ICJ7_9ACTN|nr:hypothetical protein [Kineococcus xinjiangensis]PPK91893.1 LGFP repeat-containing protein [Kineococcus xinjiangensis]